MYIYIIIIVLILIFFYYVVKYDYIYKQEHLEDINTVNSKPFIRLYEGFGYKNLVFNFEPLTQDTPAYLYLRHIYKVNLKSADINVIKRNDGLDDLRFVKIWNIYDGNNTASIESDFYNPYDESDIARRANPKYDLIVDVKAGEHLTMEFTKPIKRIFIYARL